MKSLRLLISLIILLSLCACKSTIKQQKDTLYSRHLQRQVELTIITTAMPDKKENINLLLFNDNKWLEETRAKEIIDSLYKKKQIQPLLLVAFSGLEKEYGLQEIDEAEAKQYKKYNDFIINELYHFVKKKATVRKFKVVGICGFGKSAISAFDVAWNNDEKVGLVGMFYTDFNFTASMKDSLVITSIYNLRKRPVLKIWMTANQADTTSLKFKKIMDAKKSIGECTLVTNNMNDLKSAEIFAAFLLWAYPMKID